MVSFDAYTKLKKRYRIQFFQVHFLDKTLFSHLVCYFFKWKQKQISISQQMEIKEFTKKNANQFIRLHVDTLFFWAQIPKVRIFFWKSKLKHKHLESWFRRFDVQKCSKVKHFSFLRFYITIEIPRIGLAIQIKLLFLSFSRAAYYIILDTDSTCLLKYEIGAFFYWAVAY